MYKQVEAEKIDIYHTSNYSYLFQNNNKLIISECSEKKNYNTTTKL